MTVEPPEATPDSIEAMAYSLRSQALDLLEAAAGAGLPAETRAAVVERLQRVGNDLQMAATRLGELSAEPEPPNAAQQHPSHGSQPPPSQDAAIVLALAMTAMPFASHESEQAERWVRILRMHGRVGSVLQAIGVAERPLEALAESPESRDAEAGEAVVNAVVETAADFARRQGFRTVDTVHVLMAVLAVQGPAFDRALYARGTSRGEIFDRIAESRVASV